MMAWVLIVAAGLFETGFAVALKLSHGMTRLWPTVGFAACALVSFTLLTLALPDPPARFDQGSDGQRDADRQQQSGPWPVLERAPPEAAQEEGVDGPDHRGHRRCGHEPPV